MGGFQQLILPWLLVLIFIVHDGEEVLFLPSWVQRNSSIFDDLERHYPIIRRTLCLLRENNQRQFTFSVLFLLCMITASTGSFVYQPDNPVFQFIFIGFTGVFTLHLLVHVLQSIAIRRIIPGTYTSILVFPLSIYLWQQQVDATQTTPGQSLMAVLMSMAVSPLVLVLALRFGQWAGKFSFFNKPN